MRSPDLLVAANLSSPTAFHTVPSPVSLFGRLSDKRPGQQYRMPRVSLTHEDLESDLQYTQADDKDQRSARELAVEQLVRIEDEGAYIGLVGRERGRKGQSGIPSARRREVTDLVANVTRFKRLLDWRLGQLTNRPLTSMHPVLRQILRLGLYEAFETDVPKHALSTYVTLAGTLVGAWCKGFINAILRSAARTAESGNRMVPAKPSRSSTKETVAEALAIRHSHPTWMVTRWLSQFGPSAAEQLLFANNRRPVHGVRVNALRGQSAASLALHLQDTGVTVTPSRVLPEEFVRVEDGLQQLLKSQLMQQGACMVQDESAGLVVAMLDPKPGESILDACAAPGGKTMFIAARMQNEGSLLALDSNAKRLQALQSAAQLNGVGSFLQIGASRLQDFAAEHSTASRSAASDSGRRGQSSGSECWNGFDRYHEELDEFYGTDTSIAGIMGNWGQPKNAPTSTARSSDNDRVKNSRKITAASDCDGYDDDSLDSEGLSDSEAGPLPGVPPPSQAVQRFDRVLLDVPCSGHGVLAKRADLRWRRNLSDLQDLCKLQAELLKAASALVTPGGVLVYSTCSIEPEENQQQIFAFLKNFPDFKLEPAPEGLLPQEVLTKEGFLATLPHVHRMDGAFAARLRRQR